MPIEITMPRLSDTMEEGTLIKWRVKPGDKVKSGDLLADVETDKATMELQSYDEGTVAKLAVKEGQSAPVGKLILLLAEPGESVEEVAQASGGGAGAEKAPSKHAGGSAKPGAAAAEADEDEPPVAAASGGAVGVSDRVRVSPVARKMAEDRGVDLKGLRGTGPDGRIIKRDVLAAKGTGAATPTGVPLKPGKPVVVPAARPTLSVKMESKTVPLSNMRKTIARRLVESKATIPHFTVSVAVDMDPLLSLRETLNAQLESQGVKLSVNDFILRAAALSLLAHPAVNSSWSDEGIRMHGAVNVGVAISLPEERGGGLVVATIRDTAGKGLRQLNAETRALAEKARGSGLTVEEMADGTFTISNLGMFGVEHFEAIINPPQAAILAVGAAIEKPVVRGGQVVVGREMVATLSADHRVVDGATAAAYLQTLRNNLENPAVLLV